MHVTPSLQCIGIFWVNDVRQSSSLVDNFFNDEWLAFLWNCHLKNIVLLFLLFCLEQIKQILSTVKFLVEGCYNNLCLRYLLCLPIFFAIHHHWNASCPVIMSLEKIYASDTIIPAWITFVPPYFIANYQPSSWWRCKLAAFFWLLNDILTLNIQLYYLLN